MLRALKIQADDILECIVCKESKITLASQSGFVQVYSASDDGDASTHTLIQESLWQNSVLELEVAKLTSVRYVSDYSFSKDATFYHNLKNGAS